MGQKTGGVVALGLGTGSAAAVFGKPQDERLPITRPTPAKAGAQMASRCNGALASITCRSQLDPGPRRDGVLVGGVILRTQPLSTLPCSPAKAGAQTGSPPSRGNIDAVRLHTGAPSNARSTLSVTPAEAGAHRPAHSSLSGVRSGGCRNESGMTGRPAAGTGRRLVRTRRALSPVRE